MSSESSNQIANEYPWISNSFFEKILRREHHDKTVVVKGYTLKPAINKGENYGSQLLRVRVNYSSLKDPSVDHISLIVKAALTNNAEAEAVAAEFNVFHKEIIAYQQIIPNVEKLLRSIGDHSRLSPKCYDSSEELSYLVFEDLTVSAYATVNRRTGLDLEHFKHLMTKAAKWHAATAVLLIEEPSIADEFQSSRFLTESLKQMSTQATKALVEVVEQISGFEHLSPKLQRLCTCVNEKVALAVQRNPNTFNVINHGDMWTNNVMFTHDSETGDVTDALFVDFQCGYFGSSILDILYALYTSSCDSLREQEWDEILAHYHTELVRLLNLLGYSKLAPTMFELQAERMLRIHYSALMGMFVLAVRNLENVQDDEMVKFIGTTEEDHKYRVEIMSNPKIRKGLEFLLQYCDDNGLLDD